MTPLFKKLNLGRINEILVLNAPDSFENELSLLEGVTIQRNPPARGKMVFVIGFAVTQAELDRISNELVNAVAGDAVVWVAYPKGTSKRYKCEFNRDTGWAVLGDAGLEPVRQISVDEDWSALRFRRAEYIKSLTRSQKMAISAEGKDRAGK